MSENLEKKFSEWLEMLNKRGEHNQPLTQAAATVHDEVGTAQYIADSLFGERSRNISNLVFKIYDRISMERRLTVYDRALRKLEERQQESENRIREIEKQCP